jgi:hypothetical protein
MCFDESHKIVVEDFYILKKDFTDSNHHQKRKFYFEEEDVKLELNRKIFITMN